MTFKEWFRKQYGSHQKGFGLCEADLEGAWKAALQHAAELALKADAKIERLREHAVVLAETARQVEKERCALIVDKMDNDYLRASSCRTALKRAAKAIRIDA